MIYDVNSINDESHFIELKRKLVRKDFVTYTCKKYGCLVNKGSRCYKNYNNLCHSCSVSNTIANRPEEVQKEINAKMQASRKPHLQEINNKISYRLSHRTEEEKRLSFEKRQRTCLEKYGDENYNNSKQSKKTMFERYGGLYTLNTPQLKEKVQNTNLERYGGISPMCSKEIQNKSKINYIQNNGGMGFASKTVLKKYQDNYKEKYGVTNSSQNPLVRRKQATKYKYENINFDSKPEIAYYIWLKDNNIDFEYQPNVKFEYLYENKLCYYIPDFKVENEYIEIKGLQFFKNYDINETMINPFDRTQDAKYEAKHQCMIKNNVKIITDTKFYEDYINNKYGKNYIKQFKRK